MGRSSLTLVSLLVAILAVAPPAAAEPGPEIVSAPSGALLEGGIIQARSSADTWGGAPWDLRIGLGGVAEFGLGRTDLVLVHEGNRTDKRTTRGPEGDARAEPYHTATFRLGVRADRLFIGQPGLALGFTKSFEHDVDGYHTRVASLHLAATKRLGDRVVLHVGAVMWDASVASGNTTVALHDQGMSAQLRAFGGVELRGDRMELLMDVYWAPTLCVVCRPATIEVTPWFSGGLRRRLSSWISLEAGVRLPELGHPDLLRTQVFGQVTLRDSTLRRLRH